MKVSVFLLGVVMALMSVCAYADSDSLQDDDLFFGINFFRSQEEIEESGIDFIPSPYFGPYSDMHTIEGTCVLMDHLATMQYNLIGLRTMFVDYRTASDKKKRSGRRDWDDRGEGEGRMNVDPRIDPFRR